MCVCVRVCVRVCVKDMMRCSFYPRYASMFVDGPCSYYRLLLTMKNNKPFEQVAISKILGNCLIDT